MNVYDILRRSAKLSPQALALSCQGHEYNYSEFRERVLRLAGFMDGLGITKGDRVAVLMMNCHRYLEFYYATARLGALIVPMNTRLSEGELSYILNDSEASMVAVDKYMLPILESIKGHLKTVDNFIYTSDDDTPEGMLDYEGALAGATPFEREVPVENDHPAGLFYTSGTTGGPKGVILTHMNCVSNTYHVLITFGYKESDVYMHACPMFHLADGPLSHPITMVGGKHTFLPSFDAKLALETIEKEKVSVTLFIPTMVNFIINHPDFENHDLTSLRLINYGGSPMPVELLRKAMSKIGPIFRQSYGLTETAPLLTSLPPEEHVLDGPEHRVRRLASCGREVAGVEVRVVNDEGSDVKPGEVGEIITRGPNIMKGYWRKPEETAAALRGEWLYTGDMATVDEENFVFIVDRKKDMIITGGENVFSTEVENMLYTHPAILEAAVVGVPDEKWGEAIKAIVVLKEGCSATEQEIIDYCRDNLTHYKCPRSVEFYDGDQLPKSGSGKILKAQLREKYWGGLDRRVH
jgi:long-chain acyl-CoA synthetase